MSWLNLFKAFRSKTQAEASLTYLGQSVPKEVTYRLKNQGDDLYREYPERLRIVNSTLLKFKTEIALLGVAIDVKQRPSASEIRLRPKLELLAENIQRLIELLVATPETYPLAAEEMLFNSAKLALELSQIAKTHGPSKELEQLSGKITAYHIFIKSGIFPRSPKLEDMHLKTLSEWKEKFKSEWDEKYE